MIPNFPDLHGPKETKYLNQSMTDSGPHEIRSLTYIVSEISDKATEHATIVVNIQAR